MRLTEIIIYPIKSLQGIYLDQAVVQPQGLKDDRMMMLVDDSGLFISQRKYSRLALLKVEMVSGTVVNGMAPDGTMRDYIMRGGMVKVTRPDGNSILISRASFENKKVSVTIWKDNCAGIVATDTINLWFSQFLDISARLVKYDIHNPRNTDLDYSNAGDQVSFADGFPLLVISQASLDDLNRELDDPTTRPTIMPITMKNFRPNIVIANNDAYSEDNWKKIKLGEVAFDAVKPCSRCVLTSIDPIIGRRREDREPLKTLSKYREKNGEIYFGMNLIPRSKGDIKTGDCLKIIESA